MKELLIDIAYRAIRAFVGAGLFDQLGALIRELIYKPIPNEDKREMVKEYLRTVGEKLLGWELDLIISAVRAKFEPRPVAE